MPKFNFKKSVFNPLKNMARPYVNQALGELKTKGLDALKQFATQGLQTLESTQCQYFAPAVKLVESVGKLK